MWISKQYIYIQGPLLHTQSYLLKSQIQIVALNTSSCISKRSAVVPVSKRGSASSSATSSCFVAYLPLWPSNTFLFCINCLKQRTVGAFCLVIFHWRLLSDSEQPSTSSIAVLTVREVDFCDGVQLSRTSLDSVVAVLQWTEGKLLFLMHFCFWPYLKVTVNLRKWEPHSHIKHMGRKNKLLTEAFPFLHIQETRAWLASCHGCFVRMCDFMCLLRFVSDCKVQNLLRER